MVTSKEHFEIEWPLPTTSILLKNKCVPQQFSAYIMHNHKTIIVITKNKNKAQINNGTHKITDILYHCTFHNNYWDTIPFKKDNKRETENPIIINCFVQLILEISYSFSF